MSSNGNHSIIAGAVISALIGVVVAGGYVAKTLRGDAPRAATMPVQMPITARSQSPVAEESAASNRKIDSVEVMAERLRARLEQEPNDVNGWVLLGRSYHFMGRWDDAKAAFAKARELGYQGDPEDAPAAGNPAAHGSGEANAIFGDIGRVGPDGDNATASGESP